MYFLLRKNRPLRLGFALAYTALPTMLWSGFTGDANVLGLDFQRRPPREAMLLIWHWPKNPSAARFA